MVKEKCRMVDGLEAVVFDMDGVLFDTERLCMEAWREEAAARKIDDIEKAVIGCIGLNRTDTRAFFEKEYGIEFPFDEFHSASTKRFHERLEAEGLPLKPGVTEILEYLKSAGYKIALASSTSRKGVMEHLEKASLTHFFEEIISGDMVEHSKPSPDIYLLACSRLSVFPEKAIAIEDSPNGLRSAYLAGMKPVMVPDMILPVPETEKLLFAKCENLYEVKNLLIRMEKKPNTCVLQSINRIPLQGMYNTRDLGGIRSEDGRHIKAHRLIRSEALFSSTKEDRELLLSEYKLKTIVDFRTEAEKNLKPDPYMKGITYINNPILEEETLGITRESEGTKDGNAVVKEVIARIQMSGGTPVGYMNDMYKNLITNPFSRCQYRKFFDILLNHKEGAILWHCTAGKDRVGVGTILLLSALSVPREQIMADYMKVNEFNKSEVDKLMSDLMSLPGVCEELGRKEQEAIRLLFTVDRSYAEVIFGTMEQEHGSVDAFLREEMGLTDEKREYLKDKYLE